MLMSDEWILQGKQSLQQKPATEKISHQTQHLDGELLRRQRERSDASQRRLRSPSARHMISYNGKGGLQDLPEAGRLLGIAAEQGDATAAAQLMLGSLHGNGEGGPQNIAEESLLFRLAAAAAEQGQAVVQGLLEAQLAKAEMHLNGKGEPDDHTLLEIAAAQGDIAAQAGLGNMYLNGDGVPQDLAKARRLFGLASDRGHALAQLLLGGMHQAGLGGPADLAEGRRLFRLAAAQGHAGAQFMVGGMHFEGKDGPIDLAEARRLFRLAAEQGDAGAQAMLGTMHYEGKGGPPDHAEARRLLGLAAAQGLATAQATLDDLDRDAEAQRAKDQADADAMMAQLLAEDAEEKEAKGAAKSAKSAKSTKAKKAKKNQKRGEPAAATSVGTDHLDDEVTEVEDSGKVQSAAAIATGGDAVGAAAHLLGQASLQLPAGGSSDAVDAAPASTAPAPVALGRPPPPPTAVTSLADAQFSTGRPEAPESTIGGQSTCIICFTNPKSHVAVPCGHQCACGDCSAQMRECPVCRTPVQMWMHVRMA
jgi:TPR repeat protein